MKELLDWISNNGQAAFIGGLIIAGVLVALFRCLAVMVRGWPAKDSTLNDIDDD